MRRIAPIALLAGMLLLAGCTSSSEPPLTGTGNPEPVTLAQGLDAPWSVVRLDDGSALISQRDDGQVLQLTASGSLRAVGTVPGVVSGGESGLHGLAVHEIDGIRWLYAFHGTESENRVIRMPLTGDPLGFDASKLEVVIDGIPKAGNHDGGRIAFGPDGMLYITTGDAGQRNRARDPAYLGGKILRVTPTGEAAPGNPFGTAVYSLGHRNVQGLAWDSQGRLWASEFGQDTWDELNLIEAGGDYGWPDFEGFTEGTDADVVSPMAVWAPKEASPSGIAVIDDVVYVAALRGERIWLYDTAHERDRPWAVYTEAFGRLRDVIPGPDGTFWVLTNNTDGRGNPGPDDDRLLQLTLPEG